MFFHTLVQHSVAPEFYKTGVRLDVHRQEGDRELSHAQPRNMR